MRRARTLLLLLVVVIVVESAQAFVWPLSPPRGVSSSSSSSSSRRRRASTTSSDNGQGEDPLAKWSLGTVPDDALLEAARLEAREKDAEWYQTMMGGAVPAAATSRAGVAPAPATEAPFPPSSPLLALGYTAEEAAQLPEDVARILVENSIPRPSGALPWEWLAADGDEQMAAEEEEEAVASRGKRHGARKEPAYPYQAPPVRPAPRGSKRAQRRQQAATYKKVYEVEAEMEDDLGPEDEDEDETEKAYRLGLQAPVYRRGYTAADDYEDFGPTFTEQEPGLLPLLVDKLAERVRGSTLLRPFLREDRFKYLLGQEADLRLLVTGPWAADMLRDEYRWRLGLFRDYLKVEKKQQQAGGGRGAKGRKGARRPGAMDFEGEEEEEDGFDGFLSEDEEDEEDDYYYDRRRQAWRRRSSSTPRRRADGSTGPRGGFAPSGADWEEDEEDEEELGVLETKAWSADEDEEEEEEEEEEEALRYRRRSPSASPSADRRLRRERKQDVRAGVRADRKFMGLEDDEATNDRSGAWVWRNPARSAGPAAAAGAGAGQKRSGGKAGGDGGVFRWPWDVPGGEDIDDA